MVSDMAYMDMIKDIWFDNFLSPTYEKLKHRHDDFWKRVNEEKRKAILKCAREFGEDAPWRDISQQLTEEDIDFIREFRKFIYWDEIDRNVKYETSFYNEFKKEIETALQEKLEIDAASLANNTALIDAIMEDIV